MAKSTTSKKSTMSATSKKPAKPMKRSDAVKTQQEDQKGFDTAESLFAIPELAEQIFLRLDRRDIYQAQGVSKDFKQVITDTPAIQRKLLHRTTAEKENGGPHVGNLHPLLYGKSMWVGQYSITTTFVYVVRRPGQQARYHIDCRVSAKNGKYGASKSACDLVDCSGESGSWREQRMSVDSVGFVIRPGGRDFEMEGGSTMGELVDALLAGKAKCEMKGEKEEKKGKVENKKKGRKAWKARKACKGSKAWKGKKGKKEVKEKD